MPVRIYLDTKRGTSPIDRNLLVRLVSRASWPGIYEGIYDPGSKLSDANDFREDVMGEIRHLGVPIIRHPRGQLRLRLQLAGRPRPRQDRPKVLDRAWNSLNSNQFGINEILTWGKAAAPSHSWA